jgi:hypothetical protein
VSAAWLPPVKLTADLDEAIEAGHCLVGSPATVREALRRQVAEAGVTYVMCQVAFGDLPLAASLDTIAAIESEIMPAFNGAEAAYLLRRLGRS